ncbi:hypothetical protein BT69DRAFT_1332587 [Atractiella rhizophila]|nr:hypothetical protein BT69DRAFT_1332587 [Atractiella rhizophila]
MGVYVSLEMGKYNLWYHKWAGGDKFDEYNVKEKSQTRCVLATDTGYTRADGGNNKYICLFFARGCCPYGQDCSYLHRLPPKESKLPDAARDVFGREKFSNYRDDMGGVGSFLRQNRTLYVGRLNESVRGGKEGEMEDMILRHFEEFGEVEKIRVLHGRGVAFVTYISELQAQFAKEAMMHQSLDHDEVLNVRWATEDPNPTSKEEELARLKRVGEEGIAKRLPPELVRHIRQLDDLEGLNDGLVGEGSDDEDGAPPAKRARIEAAPAPLKSVAGAAATKEKPNALGSLADYGSDDEE